MRFFDRLIIFSEAFDTKYKEQFGFKMKETSFTKFVNYLHAPKDASSLAVTRILFGLAMLFDIPDERGGTRLFKRWGDPKICHFPLFEFIQGVPMPYMSLVYAALWIGATGIMLGYKFRTCARLFTISYWYLFLIEKSYWNNHSYLFGLVGFLLTFTDANCYWSVDAILQPDKKKETVPYWNYFILKYQFFILYFMAGLKKGSAEWLAGYSVPNLSAHWVFTPFTLFLSIEQTDYIIVHWFIFVFDLTVAIWMMWSRTRHIAMIFCALFHLMNSRLFTIGMFPWVCLATMPLFYPFNWPKLVIDYIISIVHTPVPKQDDEDNNDNDHDDDDDDIFEKDEVPIDEKKDNLTKEDLKCSEIDEASKMQGERTTHLEARKKEYNACNHTEVTRRQKVTTVLIIIYMTMQGFLPFSHFITKVKTKASWYLVVTIVIIDNFQQLMILSYIRIIIIWNDKSQAFNTYFGTLCIRVANLSETGNFQKRHYMRTYRKPKAFFDPEGVDLTILLREGYNNWTDGLYGYSWDMMVHTWDVQSVTLKIVDNERNNYFYIDPNAFSPNDRWNKHGDMVHQYAKCLNNTLIKSQNQNGMLSENLSIFIDVWCSMNGRFIQRMFDPNIDLLQVSWSTFEKNPFLIPLLEEASEWRPVLSQIRSEVHSWGPFNDVIFFADFPDYVLDKYIPLELSNVTLTVLEGEVAVEAEIKNLQSQSFHLKTGHRRLLASGMFHRIMNIGNKTAYCMFTFYNQTESYVKNENIKSTFQLPIMTELQIRCANMLVFVDTLIRGFYQLFFRLPMFLV